MSATSRVLVLEDDLRLEGQRRLGRQLPPVVDAARRDVGAAGGSAQPAPSTTSPCAMRAASRPPGAGVRPGSPPSAARRRCGQCGAGADAVAQWQGRLGRAGHQSMRALGAFVEGRLRALPARSRRRCPHASALTQGAQAFTGDVARSRIDGLDGSARPPALRGVQATITSSGVWCSTKRQAGNTIRRRARPESAARCCRTRWSCRCGHRAPAPADDGFAGLSSCTRGTSCSASRASIAGLKLRPTATCTRRPLWFSSSARLGRWPSG